MNRLITKQRCIKERLDLRMRLLSVNMSDKVLHIYIYIHITVISSYTRTSSIAVINNARMRPVKKGKFTIQLDFTKYFAFKKKKKKNAEDDDQKVLSTRSSIFSLDGANMQTSRTRGNFLGFTSFINEHNIFDIIRCFHSRLQKVCLGHQHAYSQQASLEYSFI